MTARRVVLLTGSELRHDYVRKSLALADGIELASSFCEGAERGLRAQLEQKGDTGWTELAHVAAREQVERDFFKDFVKTSPDESRQVHIPKGAINDDSRFHLPRYDCNMFPHGAAS